MAITDQTVLSEIQRLLLEGVGDSGATWPSGQWTQAEVLWHLNRRQDRLLAETGITWTRLETNITVNQANQAAPADWAVTLFIALKTSAGVYQELPKMDALELDLISSTWPGASSASPRGWYEVDGDTLTTYVAPIPTDAGSALERYYVALGATLTAGGVAFTVPDELVPAVKWGTLADLLSKVGPTQNLTLAAACEGRWDEGFAMATLIAQEGWFAL